MVPSNSVTAQTGEPPPMAHRARAFLPPLIRMLIQPVRRMARRLQLLIPGMTKRATIRRVDLAVADQTIGHLREERLAHHIRLIDTPMARETGIARVQLLPNPLRIRQIL